MARLTRYLLRLFLSEAMALFVVAIFLLFLVQCFILFDLVAEQGQSLLILIQQATLGMTSLIVVILYACLGIGLARGLRGLQDRSELQVIHVSSLTGPLLRSVFGFALGGALVVLTLTHFIDPLSARSRNELAASIAADLVSRSMIPQRFTVLNGLSLRIGSRDAEGQITDFFADDSRNPEVRRTYFADSALIIRDDRGYVLRMQDGAIQQISADKNMSEIAFTRYDLALDDLTGSVEVGDSLAVKTSLDILRDAEAAGTWSPEQIEAVGRRWFEGLRVLAICLFAAAIATFPSGNRRRRFSIPVELAVLGAGFAERGIISYVPLPRPFDLGAGPAALALVAILILAFRFRFFLPPRVPRPA